MWPQEVWTWKMNCENMCGLPTRLEKFWEIVNDDQSRSTNTIIVLTRDDMEQLTCYDDKIWVTLIFLFDKKFLCFKWRSLSVVLGYLKALGNLSHSKRKILWYFTFWEVTQSEILWEDFILKTVLHIGGFNKAWRIKSKKMLQNTTIQSKRICKKKRVSKVFLYFII